MVRGSELRVAYPLSRRRSCRRERSEASGRGDGQAMPDESKQLSATRTGLKTADRHASWSEVYDECCVEGWRP